jgi:hypothetical protein
MNMAPRFDLQGMSPPYFRLWSASPSTTDLRARRPRTILWVSLAFPTLYEP